MAKKVGTQSIVLFGQDKPFKDQIEKIRELNIDFVEVKPHYHPDIKYFGERKGKIYFEKNCMDYIKELCQDLPFQLHFRDTIAGKIRNLCNGEKDYIKFILSVAEETNKYFEDFVVTTHLTYSEKGFQDIPVEEAMKNAKKGLEKLYKKWDFSGKLALETMMEPFVYKDVALLGHEPKQLEYLLEGKQDKFGICIDTGHLNKGLNNNHSFNNFTYLPVNEIHFHGNYAHIGMIDDKHILPREETLVDYHEIMDYLKNYKGFLNLEVKNIVSVNWLKEKIESVR